MQKTLSLLKNYAEVIADEIDLILHSRHEINYAIGNKCTLKPERIDAVADLWKTIIQFFEGREIFADTVKYESIKENIVEGLIEKQLPKIASHFDVNPNKLKNWDLDEAKASKFKQSKERSYNMAPLSIVQSRELSLSSKTDSSACLGLQAEKELFKNYLLGRTELDTKIISNADLQDLLALMKAEITLILPLTLDRRCDMAYGFSPKQNYPFAVPYASNNTPVKKAEFGNVYEMLNYTMQTFLNKNISVQRIAPYIRTIQNNLRKEQSQFPKMSLKELPAYKDLQKYIGRKDFNPFSHAIDDSIAEHLGKNRDLLVDFVSKYIFSLASIYEHKISMNGIGLVSLFKNFQGFTGTLWNSATYPSHLNIRLDKTADGEAVCLFLKKVRAIHRLQNESVNEALQEIVQKYSPQHKAIIDVGAVFRGYDNETVARILLERLPTAVEGIGFYEKDRLMMMERSNRIVPSESSHIPLDCRFIYYDQRHITGTNVQHVPDAGALMTFGKNMTLRDLMQAAWRMRNLRGDQYLDVIVSPSAYNAIKTTFSKLSPLSLLAYAWTEQQKQLDEHCLLAAPRKIWQKPKDLFAQEVLDADLSNKSNREALNALSRALLLIPTADRPFLSYGLLDREVSHEKYREILLSEFSRSLKKLTQSEFTDRFVHTTLQQITALSLPLPQKVLMNSRMHGCTVEIEKIQEKEQEVNAQISLQQTEGEIPSDLVQLHLPPTSKPFDPTCHATSFNKLAVCSVNNLLEAKDLSPIFDDSLLVSSNFIPFTMPERLDSRTLFEFTDSDLQFWLDWEEGKRPKEPEVLMKKELFLSSQTPVQYLLVFQLSDNSIKMRFLDYEEAAFFLLELSQATTKNNLPVALCDIHLGCLVSAGVAFDFSQDLKVQRLFVQAKFFSGETNYSDEECHILQEWMRSKGKEQVVTVFQKIMHGRPMLQHRFQTSVLREILK